MSETHQQRANRQKRPQKSRSLQSVLRSPAWKALRAQALTHFGSKCNLCGTTTDPLRLTHRHYKTVGRETLADVRLLCVKCHDELRAMHKPARAKPEAHKPVTMPAYDPDAIAPWEDLPA